ncbi:MAG TPA: peptidase M6 [Actinomycetota bacterium]
MRRRWLGLSVAILLGAGLVTATGAQALQGSGARRTADVQVKQTPPDMKGKRLALHQARQAVASMTASPIARATAQLASSVGDQKYWLALDNTNQLLYVKLYTLRGIGDHIEVWVASDADEVSEGTDFPYGDCRNGVRTEITDDQVNYLIDQFDSNIYPKESATFSVPPDRDGTNSLLAEILDLPPDYYQGDGDDIAVLVDNVRDDNFYDTDNQHTLSYIAGFFSSQYNELLNRNAMTIDAFDWLHRTGANPPHEPSTDPCTSAPARPFLYEGVFAHEYQHLLEYYEDPGETIWINEGLSDWAQTLTGYVDPTIPIDQLGYDSHIQCFLGYLGVQTEFNPIPRPGGPENSLNLWGDQTDFESEILCDYGAAYSMMLLLADRFGPEFMGDLHRDDLHGFESLQGLLSAAGSDLTIDELVDEWAAMAALDGVLDDGANLKGGKAADFRVSTLDATINWDTDQTYSSPGAPPNGSDFVRVRDGSGYLDAKSVHTITFDGVSELPPLPLEWTVDPNPADQPGDAALYAGTGDNLDRSIVREVDVPAGSPQLTFDADWSLEEGFDYGYVQVSTDGGESYGTIPCSDQVEGPLGSAYNGESDAFLAESCDLSDFAGQTVVLAFRMVTDSSVHFGGFWVDDVAVDGTVLSDGSTLEGWSSPTEFNPIDVEGYTVRLIAYGGHKAWIATLHLDPDFDGVISGGNLNQAIGSQAPVVAAIVTYHDSTEQVQQYAPYTLTVNGVLQPGG